MTFGGIAAHFKKNSQGRWIRMSCGVSVTAGRFVGSFAEDAALGPFAGVRLRTDVANYRFEHVMQFRQD